MEYLLFSDWRYHFKIELEDKELTFRWVWNEYAKTYYVDIGLFVNGYDEKVIQNRACYPESVLNRNTELLKDGVLLLKKRMDFFDKGEFDSAEDFSKKLSLHYERV